MPISLLRCSHSSSAPIKSHRQFERITAPFADDSAAKEQNDPVQLLRTGGSVFRRKKAYPPSPPIST
jgi:hypothetical protein